MMKGVILAGGSGTRLHPLTKYINKHLLPVGPYPMIYWSIMKLRDAGINEILIITNANDLHSFIKLLNFGEELHVRIHYTVQNGAVGIADGVSLAESFVKDNKFVVLLGDNIFEKSLKQYVENYNKIGSGAMVLLKPVKDPNRFGIATIDTESQRVTSIVEKPENPQSDLCVTGIYFYDAKFFDYVKEIEPSYRGELEITDVNNCYLKTGKLFYELLDGWWIDAGTHEALHQSNSLAFDYLEESVNRYE